MMNVVAAIAMTAALGLSQQPDFNEQETDICPGLGGLAESIMRNRQDGVSMSEMMQIIPPDDGTDPVLPLVRVMIISAFEQPRFQTDRHQWREIQDFRADWELACYQETWNGGTRD